MLFSRSFFPSFVTTHLVSNPFNRRWQELLATLSFGEGLGVRLVALPPPVKVVFNLHGVFTATGARIFVV
jgi:hypothetical protein